jgi:N-acetylglutamate synthase-like GNAT family acetyltransferase
MSIAIAVVGADERAEVEAFYRAQLGRDVPLEVDQQVFAARDGNIVVAALRLCPEAGTLLLRTVVVAEGRRGQGIGHSLLLEASRAIGRRECWCFPWSYLDHFYMAIGLARASDAAVPDALRHRKGPDCIATYRALSG